jgi:hypothetical protein
LRLYAFPIVAKTTTLLTTFFMPLKPFTCFLFFICISLQVIGQKAFNEGVIIYKVKMVPDQAKFKPGTFTLTIKGEQLKKEMKMNGLEYVMVMDCATQKGFSLQNKNGKKYAIELKMEDMLKDQEKFQNYNITTERNENKKIAGYVVFSGDLHYKDGSNATVNYSKEWKPALAIAFERFPRADFLPLDFSYNDLSGVGMRFEAEKIIPGPVENAVFRVPAEYKIISYEEYKALSK